MEAEEAYRRVISSVAFEVGRFFFQGQDIALGKGKVYQGVRFPLYNDESALFDTIEGLVYVLTHECDIDQNNERLFNTEVLICPIIPFGDLISTYLEEVPQGQFAGFLGNLGARNVSRVVYLPPWQPQLEFGGVMYLNQITSTHVSAFTLESVKPVCTLTAYGLQIVEWMIENHLLRPKAEPLAFAQ